MDHWADPVGPLYVCYYILPLTIELSVLGFAEQGPRGALNFQPGPSPWVCFVSYTLPSLVAGLSSGTLNLLFYWSVVF